jgi:spoIIIJ-associated protein
MNSPNPADEGGRRVVEVEARTVDEAVARGLVRLGGLSRNEVDIEVLDEGRSGLLGFGSTPVRVRLTELPRGGTPVLEPVRKPATGAAGENPPPAAVTDQSAAPMAPPAPTLPPAAEPAAIEAVAREVVGTMLGLLGYEDLSFDAQTTLLPEAIEGEESLVLSIQGSGTDRLLADEARPLNALQFLSRLIVSRRTAHWANLLLDVGGDRARRMRELYQLAEQSAELVERDGRAVSLPPMTPYERRVVHLALRNHPSVATQSIGTGEGRKVTVRRKDQLLPEM